MADEESWMVDDTDWVWFHDYERRDDLLWEVPDRLVRLQQRSKEDWFRAIDVGHVRERLKLLADGFNPDGLMAVVLNNTHLLIFSLSLAWYAPGKRLLVEQFFVRIAPGDEAGAYEALELLAEDLEASHIIMATALARRDDALGKVYERYGFSKQSTQYVKESRWQQSAQSSPGSGS